MTVSVTSRRVVWADALRLAACLCVVMIHAASPLFTTGEVGSAAFTTGYVADCLVQIGVPLFVMVSGVFMLDKARAVTTERAVRHYALPMVGLYFLWSFLYALANKVAEPILLGGATVDGEMVREFLRACVEGAFHLWYLPMTVVLYLLTPLLRAFLHSNDPRAPRYLLAVGGVFAFLVPTLVGLAEEFLGWPLGGVVDKFYLQLPLYPVYYVAGWVIANHRPSKGARWAVYGGGAAGLIAMVGLTAVTSARHVEAVAEWMEPSSLFCALYAAAVFAAFCWGMGERPVSDRTARIIGRLSRLTLGVYLIHIEVRSLYTAFLPYDGGNPVVYMLTQWLVVTAISFAASWVLSLIPVVRRAVRG